MRWRQGGGGFRDASRLGECASILLTVKERRQRQCGGGEVLLLVGELLLLDDACIPSSDCSWMASSLVSASSSSRGKEKRDFEMAMIEGKLISDSCSRGYFVFADSTPLLKMHLQ